MLVVALEAFSLDQSRRRENAAWAFCCVWASEEVVVVGWGSESQAWDSRRRCARQ